MKRLIIVLVLALLLMACSGMGADRDMQSEKADNVGANFFRQVDEEAGVACWIYYGSADGVAMDCLPIRDTTLSTGR